MRVKMPDYIKIVCVSGHDRCYEGASEDCPYCEKYMKHVKILIGIPGTGKSTYAERQKDFVIVSRDGIIEQIAKEKGLTYNEAFGKINQADVNEFFYADLYKAISAGQNVVVDRTHLTKKIRKEIIQGFKQDGYYIEAVVFVVPEPELKRRLHDRERRTGKTIPTDVIKGMAAKYESPSKEEGFDKITYVR